MKNLLLKILRMYLVPAIVPLTMACDYDRKNKLENGSLQIAATLDDEEVTVEEVDALIQSQLYESLYGIYYKRKVALTELLADKVLIKEAKSRGINKETLIKTEVSSKKTDEGLQKFIKDNQLDLGIPDPNNPLHSYDIDTEEGKLYLNKIYEQKLLEDYILSLQEKYNLHLTLSPPLTPKINLKGVAGHYRGKKNSAVQIMIIADFECSQCRNLAPLFDHLYNLYKDKVGFQYVHFSSQVTLPALISECAAEQGKFWEMHDLLFRSQPADTLEYYSLAGSIGLDINKLKTRLKNSKDIYVKMDTNISKLHRAGISLTPTLIINERVYYGQFTLEAIKSYIEKELQRGT